MQKKKKRATPKSEQAKSIQDIVQYKTAVYAKKGKHSFL